MGKRIECYKCYSNNLKEFLMKEGNEYIAIAMDIKRNKTFWLFVKDKDLDIALTKWTDGKPMTKV